ncbi:helix-turn-helix transcriptional regulator [Sphingobacterium alkalisoli]|uniref:Helix-turn-helix transcriptional regulator n=1 Tax=Sphingobacterium alkalisoli TaxID=1874115 RepID=A0A4U0GYK5_9SPHI|nr:helix-turn-helix transcriptional regulator [Sphingobacterium alkalisoli]TJY63784.1 helix-turn-helix transcriptional regulator [Sphingobacterium alkalisoli]GGH24898.1 hypothetical protein GCM10011418_33140 [Sphingobacterium alkalisoli]
MKRFEMNSLDFAHASWQEISDKLIDNYLTLVDLYIRKQKDYEYSFVGYSNAKLVEMLEHKAKFEFSIDEVIAEIRRLARTHKYKVVYDNINLFIWFADKNGTTVGNLYLIEEHMGAEELGTLYASRKDFEDNLLQHIEDFKEFVKIHWDPDNGIIYRMRTNEIFKRVREEAGLSQVQVAEMVDATQGTISNIEKSLGSNPTYDIIQKYISKVGANPMFLFGLDFSAPPIIHPTVQRERMGGKKEDKVRDDLIKELESVVKKLKSL